MEIKCIEDVQRVADEMHDSEFQEKDFSFDSEKKTFHLKSYSADIPGKEFYLELHNVEIYEPRNLERIKKGKATGGVFNKIKIGNNGLKLTLISQDLNVVLSLIKIADKFEIRGAKKVTP